MRSLAQWLELYGVSHQHTVNKSIHHVCVPAIQFSLLGLLWLVRLPFAESLPHPLANLATIIVLLLLPWYFVLSWRIAIGMMLLSLSMLVVIHVLYSTGLLLELSVGVFAIAWAGQFVGHHIEGRKPSFFDDLRFLLIGPLWVISHFYELMGIPVEAKQ